MLHRCLPTHFEFDYLEISNVDYSGIVDSQAMEHISFEDAPSRARRRTSLGCTVVSSVRPNLQAVAFLENVRSDLICSTGFNVVQSHEERLHPRFAYYVLISERSRQYLEATATGVGYPAVADKDFNSLDIPLPPRSEQEFIVHYLDNNCAAIDAAVARKQRQIETLDALRRSMIMHSVIGGVASNPKLKRVDKDWLNEIPSHWEVCRPQTCSDQDGLRDF
jgi:restriction endonuclease S subunit